MTTEIIDGMVWRQQRKEHDSEPEFYLVAWNRFTARRIVRDMIRDEIIHVPPVDRRRVDLALDCA